MPLIPAIIMMKNEERLEKFCRHDPGGLSCYTENAGVELSLSSADCRTLMQIRSRSLAHSTLKMLVRGLGLEVASSMVGLPVVIYLTH